MSGLPITPRTVPLSTAAVQAALLKQIGQQVAGAVEGEPLKVGQVIPARVAAGPDGQPVLMLGGVRIQAQLPASVEVGQFLRLRVQEHTPERVMLQIVQDPAHAAATTASAAGDLGAAAGPQQAQQTAGAQQAGGAVPWAAIPMPNGASARLYLDPDKSGSGAESDRGANRPRTMVIRYDSPVLGRTDVVLQLDPDQLQAAVLTASGALDLIRSTVPGLRVALGAAVDRPVAIVTGGRATEELDVRA